jgi:hypothetical protein
VVTTVVVVVCSTTVVAGSWADARCGVKHDPAARSAAARVASIGFVLIIGFLCFAVFDPHMKRGQGFPSITRARAKIFRSMEIRSQVFPAVVPSEAGQSDGSNLVKTGKPQVLPWNAFDAAPGRVAK